LIAISILLCYGFADRLARILGATGMTVITWFVSGCRLLGAGSKHTGVYDAAHRLTKDRIAQIQWL